jgi:hypothetical protein
VHSSTRTATTKTPIIIITIIMGFTTGSRAQVPGKKENL